MANFWLSLPCCIASRGLCGIMLIVPKYGEDYMSVPQLRGAYLLKHNSKRTRYLFQFLYTLGSVSIIIRALYICYVLMCKLFQGAVLRQYPILTAGKVNHVYLAHGSKVVRLK